MESVYSAPLRAANPAMKERTDYFTHRGAFVPAESLPQPLYFPHLSPANESPASSPPPPPPRRGACFPPIRTRLHFSCCESDRTEHCIRRSWLLRFHIAANVVVPATVPIVDSLVCGRISILIPTNFPPQTSSQPLCEMRSTPFRSRNYCRRCPTTFPWLFPSPPQLVSELPPQPLMLVLLPLKKNPR